MKIIFPKSKYADLSGKILLRTLAIDFAKPIAIFCSIPILIILVFQVDGTINGNQATPIESAIAWLIGSISLYLGLLIIGFFVFSIENTRRKIFDD